MFVCGAVDVSVTICCCGSWVRTDCTFRPIYVFGRTIRFCGGGGGVYGCLVNMPPERPLVGFRIFDAR